MAGLLAGVGKSALGGAAKNVAKDKAKDFITSEKESKTVQSRRRVVRKKDLVKEVAH